MTTPTTKARVTDTVDPMVVLCPYAQGYDDGITGKPRDKAKCDEAMGYATGWRDGHADGKDEHND